MEERKWVSDIYMDPLLPYKDAKVAAALCVRGPIKYALVEGSGITEAWLAQDVVPHILLQCPHESSCIGMTLALPLLWACLEQTSNAVKSTRRLETEHTRCLCSNLSA